MASTIDREPGKDALIAAFCHTRLLLATYNRAATAYKERSDSRLPFGSDRTIAAVRGDSAR